MSEKKQKRKEEKKLKKSTAKKKTSSQNDIHYEAMMKSGICYLGNNLYSGAIRFSDITYHTSKEDEKKNIFERYMELLNSLVNTSGVQIFYHNRFVDKEYFSNNVLLKQHADNFNHFRDELNANLNQKTIQGRNKVECDREIIYTVNEPNIDAAVKSLNHLSKEYIKKLEQFGCSCQVLTGLDRLESIFALLNPTARFEFSYDSLVRSKLSTKNFIAPGEFIWNENKEYFRIEQRYAKVLRLHDYSTELSDKFITDIMNIDTNISSSFHMQVIERGDDISLLNKNIVQMEMEINSKQNDARNSDQSMAFLPYELELSYAEGRELLEDVKERNQRLFICQYLIFLNCESLDELETLEKKVLNKAKEHTTIIKNCEYFREKSLNSILPLGRTQLPYARMLNTASAGILIPFNSKELQDTEGCYYGVNPTTGRLILADRIKLKTASGFVLATPGSGKSFNCKQEFTWIYLKDPKSDIFIIDPENEYIPPVQELGGSVLKIDTRSGLHINIYDGDPLDDEYISSKVEVTMAIASEVLGVSSELPGTLKSAIEKAVRQLCTKYIAEVENEKISGKKSTPPTLTQFREALKNNKNSDVKELYDSLEMYTGDGTYNLFGSQSNIEVKNRITAYSIRDVGKTLKPLAMTVILESLWAKVIENFKKGKRTYIYCDEFHVLLRSPHTLEFFFDFFKRARKFGAVLTCITQNVEELLINDAARMMLSNSEWLLLLNQAQKDRKQLGDLLNLSETELDYITNSKKGCGLIRYGKEIVPFENEFPKNTKLYDLWSTDFTEKMLKNA